MRNGLRQDHLHVIRRHVITALQQRLRLGRPQHSNACAWREALHKPLAAAAGGDQILHVIEQRVGRVNGQHLCLKRQHFGLGQERAHGVDHGAPVVAGEQFALGGAVGVTQRNAHQKAIQLRLGQSVGAQLVVRILRGDDKKRLGQGACFTFHTHLFFFHRFQERALGFRTGPVDLVGQQHLRENWARVKHKGLFAALVNRHAGEVARHQVRGELHP